MAAANLTAERVRELLHFDPATGLFTWRTTGPGKRTDRAGGASGHGYIKVRIDRQLVYAHRLAWLYVHGFWPVGEVDHINGIRDDNRLVNLREATRSQNMQNQRRARGRIGLLGASWEKRYEKWAAYINTAGRRTFLGHHPTEAEAHAAYLAAKRAHHQFGML